MSLPSVRTVNCPRCGEAFKATVWETINATVDPALREKVLNGSIRDQICPNCKAQVYLDTDLIYHDMDRKFMISLIQPRPDKPFAAPTEFVDRFARMLPKYRLRFVTSYNQLCEKIVIFEADLFDVALEAMKPSLWRRLFPDKKITNDSLLLYKVTREGSNPQKLSFCFWDEVKGQGQVHVPLSTYASAVTFIGEEKIRTYKVGQWQLVNQSNLNWQDFA